MIASIPWRLGVRRPEQCRAYALASLYQLPLDHKLTQLTPNLMMASIRKANKKRKRTATTETRRFTFKHVLQAPCSVPWFVHPRIAVAVRGSLAHLCFRVCSRESVG